LGHGLEDTRLQYLVADNALRAQTRLRAHFAARNAGRPVRCHTHRTAVVYTLVVNGLPCARNRPIAVVLIQERAGTSSLTRFVHSVQQ
jgi:hypothetical protein